MRKKKLIYNTVSSLIFQVTTIVCGFILPRLILNAFGSNVNGLVNSITQFLGIISFLELGVGAVVQSALYKPLAENRQNDVSKIISSANKFFRRLAQILTVYVIVLVIFYPMLAAKEYGFLYTATLIVAISISSFAQYYFGIVNRLLLTADQKGYVQYTTQTIAVVGNTIACYLLIMLGCGIQVVKLTTSIIYLIQPFAIYLYVRKHYQIDTKIKYDKEPIPQKWNGIAQHVAAVILDGTDTVVLTLFATLADVSIYSVYFLVVKGVKQLFMSMTNGITSLIGELWARQKLTELKKTFGWTEWVIHTGTTFVFGVTAVLIVPFVRVYTLGIDDANYIQPLFAALIVAANAAHCLRLPYNIMILAAGHYKQTQNNYIIAAVINIVVSVLAVKAWGLIGVAIGTLLAMGYQTVWMAWYDSKNLIQWPFAKFLKQIIVDIITVILCSIASRVFSMMTVSYFGWVINAIEVAAVWLVIMVIVNLIFYRDKATKLVSDLKFKMVR
ncbi:MAG: polysaccharide biosynthesis C-terminal domain-containing protein [Firmicutes bacterium]|nr:polysaccharide biosynthesis C-terminal domain-containing protein [Bacillota bacterium]